MRLDRAPSDHRVAVETMEMVAAAVVVVAIAKAVVEAVVEAMATAVDAVMETRADANLPAEILEAEILVGSGGAITPAIAIETAMMIKQ
jgi:hypothetical protein